jgi:hypothetical protein
MSIPNPPPKVEPGAAANNPKAPTAAMEMFLIFERLITRVSCSAAADNSAGGCNLNFSPDVPRFPIWLFARTTSDNTTQPPSQYEKPAAVT